MRTVAGETVAFVVSVLVSVTVTPPAPAGPDKETAIGADWPGDNDRFDGSPIAPRTATVTVAVVSGRFGKELAWIVAVPAAMLVTGTLTLVEPPGMVTVAGTVATLVLLELRLTVTPLLGAGDDRVSVRFCVAIPLIVRVGGVKLSDAVTSTEPLSLANPGADAVIVADPKLTPVTCGCTAGVVWPAGMITVAGETVTFGELDTKVTVTFVGACPLKLMGKATGRFRGAFVLSGTMTDPRATTVILAVVSARFGKSLAWIVVAPDATPVTGTLTLVPPAGKLPVGGTVAAAVLLELRFMTSPAGAGDDRVRLRFFVSPEAMVKDCGVKLRPEVTVTVSLAVMKPGDDAVIVTDPKLTPVN